MVFEALPAPAPGIVPCFSHPARRIRARSIEVGGEHQAIDLVGLSPTFVDALTKLEKVARYEEPSWSPVKVASARTIRAGAARRGKPKGIYVPVNAAVPGQQLDGRRCSATSRGVLPAPGRPSRSVRKAPAQSFSSTELTSSGAQAILLRTLSTGEFRPLGGGNSRSAHARVVSATNRPLNNLVMAGGFRYDLLLPAPVLSSRDSSIAPPRGRLAADPGALAAASAAAGRVAKLFSTEALAMLADYDWPGNVRQLIGLVTTRYVMADAVSIDLRDVESLLERSDRSPDAGQTAPTADTAGWWTTGTTSGRSCTSRSWIAS